MIPIRRHLALLALAAALSAIATAATTQENWDNRCAGCHGATGDGKTKEGAKHHIKDYTDAKFQAQFTDAGLLKNLLLGVQGADGKYRMPAYKDEITVAEARELVALIRTFGKK